MKRQKGHLRYLVLTCCAVGVLAAANQSWADSTITNCTQITAAVETDKDSTPANKATDQAIIDAITAATNEDDEACAPVSIVSIFDLGDAPDTYGTTGASAAKHEIVPGLRLGGTVDEEADGQPNADANGDGADEDGVTIPAGFVDGEAVSLPVTATNTGAVPAFLGCWIDYNGNGTFDAAEYGGASVPAGSTNLAIAVTMPTVPLTASEDTGGASYARCRLSTAAIDASKANGALLDGEVEDYKVVFDAEPVFDLALRKRLATAQATNVKAGDDVTFTIEVINQGLKVDASNISIVDYIPAGMTLADTDWTDNGDGTATLKTAIASLAVGATTTVDITMKVSDTVAAGTLTNTAEITAATPSITGLTDKDSTPDTTNSDPFVDDVIDNTGGDEDDHDKADVVVDPTVDLKITKAVVDTLGAPLTSTNRGKTVVYVLTVTNEGVDTATGVVVKDILPTTLSYVSDDGAGAYDNTTGNWTIAGSLAPTATVTLKITVTVK